MFVFPEVPRGRLEEGEYRNTFTTPDLPSSYL